MTFTPYIPYSLTLTLLRTHNKFFGYELLASLTFLHKSLYVNGKIKGEAIKTHLS